MLSQKELDAKTNEELLILYKQTNDQKIKQTLVLRYIYIVKNEFFHLLADLSNQFLH